MTDEAPRFRDYSLTGIDARPGFEPGQWYSSPIPRKRLKQLMRRSDRKGLINNGLWIGLTVVTGCLLVATWGSWWALPAAFVYGIFYGSGADSRWHECGHGTVFKTRWLNNVFYHLASFMSLKNPYLWRWSHTRHHTDTIVVGRDPEIAFPRPPSILGMFTNLLYLRSGLKEFDRMIRLSLGRLTDDEKQYLIESERPPAFWTSRVHLAVHLSVVGVSIWTQSWLPLMLIGLPSFYGSWLHHLLAATQHAGLAEDLPDHRLNSRTVYLNPFFSFIYSNMNYHVEHHMYPMVPFYTLPELHEEIKNDCPPAYSSSIAAYREMIPAMLRQRRDPNHFVRRPLPEQANPTPHYVRPQFVYAT
ncbi:MAG: fatty acid desaturase [Rhodobacteraceae bacterium]|nr:fatty acid desaturase [Paracoccaceae bacterium]